MTEGEKSIVVCVRVWHDGRDGKTRFTVFHWGNNVCDDMTNEGLWVGRWMFHSETIAIVVNRIYSDMDVYSIIRQRNKEFDINFDAADCLMSRANNISIAFAGKKFSVLDISIPME